MIMKLFAIYQNLKQKSLYLLSKGTLDEYFDILVKIARVEKHLVELRYLN